MQRPDSMNSYLRPLPTASEKAYVRLCDGGVKPPHCAPESALGWRGESPLQVQRKPVTDCNCVVVRRGGQQQEVNDQSARSFPVREETELDSAGVRWRACSAVAKPRVPVGKRTRSGMRSRFDPPPGNVPGRGRSLRRWLETEWWEGQGRESGRPGRAGATRVVAGKTPEHYRGGAGRSQSAHSSEERP
jgi:hypothetical protein